MTKQWKCTVCGYIHEGKTPPDFCPVCGAVKYQFILNEPLPGDLEKRLKEALAGESKAYIRNTAFARKADQEGYPQIARLFRAVAEAEKVHDEEYLKYLEGIIGTTEDKETLNVYLTRRHAALLRLDDGHDVSDRLIDLVALAEDQVVEERQLPDLADRRPCPYR